MIANKLILSDKHFSLITRIQVLMIDDELNHMWRLPYDKKWVTKFLNSIKEKRVYTKEQGKILNDFRNSFYEELQNMYTDV